jgi:hypothetical protein
MFHTIGEDVLVRAEHALADGSARTLWWLFRFDGRDLIQALSFATESAAMNAAVA